MCIAIPWRTLRQLVDGVGRQRESVEKLLDRRGDGEDGARGRLLRRAISLCSFIALIDLRHYCLAS